MGSRLKVDGVENVYKAAELWVERALRSDDSLFTPDVKIWSSQWLRELRERFLDRPDESGDSFLQKLERQLEDSPPEVYQLMGEALYVYFLIVSTKDSTDEERVINTVLNWSPAPVVIPQDLVTGLVPGIGNPGQMFHSARPFQVGLVIEFVEQWKEHDSFERKRLLDDPWAFKDYAARLNFQSVLLRDDPNRPRSQREALLHLVFPDTFDGIVSVDHKEIIAKTFVEFVNEPTKDVDRQLQQIRPALEAKFGAGDHFFYTPQIRGLWDANYKPDLWGDFVRRAQAYVDTGKLEEEEIEYKVAIGRNLSEVREALLGGKDDWASGLKSGFADNLIHYISQARLREWIAEFPEDASTALKAIWARDGSPVSDRIETFSKLLPSSVVSGSGSRLSVASVLLMGLDVDQFPPFRPTIFNDAYAITGLEQPPNDADEAALYEHALGFLDSFIEEASGRGLKLRHRLDAQSVVWAVVRGRDEESPGGGGEGPESGKEATGDPESSQYEPDLPALAEEVFMPVEFLERIEELIQEKKQVIFQGPPGTGKTYVAQKLANCLAGSKDRVTLVQFHPSYAYEDFVQGFRPVATGNGQAGFELRDGPLLKAAERAKSEPNARHFLVIDEINRGNLAKVFGELYFLLEYRDEEISLQYQQGDDNKFSLPENLHIIGTMNTADRSIALVDLALRRRFYFVEFHPDDEPVRSVVHEWLSENAPGMDWVADVVESANEKLRDDRHAAIGPSYFMQKGLNGEAVERIWRHSVRPYVEECLFGDSDRIGEFDLKKLMADLPPRDCIADGLSRFLGISKEDAEGLLEAEGGVTQADISNRFEVWHAAYKSAGLKRIAFPQTTKPTLKQLAADTPSFIARVWDHMVTVIDGEPFEACGNNTDMSRKPNHYWTMDDNAGNAQVSFEHSGDA